MGLLSEVDPRALEDEVIGIVAAVAPLWSNVMDMVLEVGLGKAGGIVIENGTAPILTTENVLTGEITKDPLNEMIETGIPWAGGTIVHLAATVLALKLQAPHVLSLPRPCIHLTQILLSHLADSLRRSLLLILDVRT